ncbi:putative estradiol 17 beta-dehydrogenase [Nemania diffusa]|nr:putative estradiol 17 beta-dehydrogenase [Nemania diffusa]
MAPSVSSIRTQFFPPKPQFTEKDAGSLRGKVYIVTGVNSDVGRELARLLYSKNGKVYVTTLFEETVKEIIRSIKRSSPKSSGSLIFLPLNLGNLSSIKSSVEQFLAAETKLHVLFNNAGHRNLEGTIERTASGYEKHLQLNCLGTFLFTKLLGPILTATANDRKTPPNTVRTIFLSSCAAELFGEKDTGFNMDNLDYHKEMPTRYCYGISKLGNWAYAVELPKHFKGVIGVPVNPGHLRTDKCYYTGKIPQWLAEPFHSPAVNGAYALFWAGVSPDVTATESGHYVIPFGRFHPIRHDLNAATKSEAEGGNGTTAKFWDWSEAQIAEFS